MKRFRNEEMQKLYQHYLVSGPAGYVKDLFESMGVKNLKEKADLRMQVNMASVTMDWKKGKMHRFSYAKS